RASKPPRNHDEATAHRARPFVRLPWLPYLCVMAQLDPLRHNREALFWVLHTGAWTGWVISQMLGALVYEKMGGYPKVIVVGAVSGFLLSLGLRYICRWLWNRPPVAMIAGVVVSCYVLALCW